MTLNSSTVSAGDIANASQYNNLREDVLLNGGDATGTVGGTADAITLSIDSQYTAYANGDKIRFKAASDNTTTTTINVNSIGVKTIKNVDGQDLQPKSIRSGAWIEIQYDGTDFILTSSSILHTAKGDLISASADGTPRALGVGSNNQGLIADSGETTGLKWGDIALASMQSGWAHYGAINFNSITTPGGFSTSDYSAVISNSSDASDFCSTGTFINNGDDQAPSEIFLRFSIEYNANSNQTTDLNFGLVEFANGLSQAVDSTSAAFLGVGVDSLTNTSTTLVTRVCDGSSVTNTSLGTITEFTSHIITIYYDGTDAIFTLDGGSPVTVSTNVPLITDLAAAGLGFVETASTSGTRGMTMRNFFISVKY